MHEALKISVLTPSFNTGKYLKRAIDSVLKQDYSNWEHIIMDGGSTDETLQVLESYDHLIWNSGKDAGQSDAMNKAFEKSTGHLIIYLNADDEISEGWFKTIAGYFQQHPDVDMLVGDILLEENGTINSQSPSVDIDQIINPMNFNFPYNPVGYVYKRELQIAVGNFPLSNHFAMDYWFLLRAYLKGNIKKLDQIGGTFYQDGNNKTSDTARAIEGLKRVQTEFCKEFFYSKPVLGFVTNEVKAKASRKIRRVFNAK